MRVLAWNIRQGGGRRLDDIAGAIAAHQPDVVVLSELRARTAPALRALLSDAQLSYGEHTDPVGLEYGILVGARMPLRRLAPSRPSTILRHGLLEVELPNGYVIGAVYGPMLTPAHGPFWSEIVAHAAANVHRPYLLIGDFNTGEAGVDAYKKPFAGSDQFVALRTAGYVDLWRVNNATTEHTWFSFGRGGVQLNGFRIDHALGSPMVAKTLTGSRYSHAERERRLSDHSVLLVDLAAPTD